MLFNSYIFVFLFLPVALIGYFGLNKFKKHVWAECFLILMSLWFYAYFNLSYLPIIVASIVINFGLGQLFAKDLSGKIRIALLTFGVIANVGVLFYYKYMGFFVHNINVLFNTEFFESTILLPLGISFFTFQQLSYVIDSYRKQVPRYTFRQYALFVTFFPQLIAGPIVLHSETIPQFEDQTKKQFDWDNFSKGVTAFSFGLAKKVLIADRFSGAVTWGYANVDLLNSTETILVMLSYTIQIYFDFSGYCDMATGIAKMFNIDLPINFNSPYKAFSVTEFWKRWHMTLTRFLKTYLYFPLGGNRKGTWRTYLNLFIVFFVSGLWHGANYTFLVWGALHGIVMVVERIFKKPLERLHPALQWMYTFCFVNVAWVFFRSDSLTQAITLIKKVILFNFGAISSDLQSALSDEMLDLLFANVTVLGYYFTDRYYMIFIGLVCVSLLALKNTNEKIEKFKPSLILAVLCSGLFVYSVLQFSGVSEFLYFNF